MTMKKLLAGIGLVTLLGVGLVFGQANVTGANWGWITVGSNVPGTTNTGDVNIGGAFRVAGVQVAGPGLGTTTNCVSGASPAVCAAATAGGGAVPTGSNPTLVVDTTAVTANSLILLTPDESLGTKLTVTCNTTITTVGPIVVTARTPGTSFTVQVDATVATNPACFSWVLVN